MPQSWGERPGYCPRTRWSTPNWHADCECLRCRGRQMPSDRLLRAENTVEGCRPTWPLALTFDMPQGTRRSADSSRSPTRCCHRSTAESPENARTERFGEAVGVDAVPDGHFEVHRRLGAQGVRR